MLTGNFLIIWGRQIKGEGKNEYGHLGRRPGDKSLVSIDLPNPSCDLVNQSRTVISSPQVLLECPPERTWTGVGQTEVSHLIASA